MPYTLVLSREIKFYILQKQLVKIASAFAVGLFLAIITSLVTQSSTAHAASQPSTTGDRESTIRATHTPRSKLGTASKAALHGVRNTTKKQAQTSPAYNPPPYNPPPYNPPAYNPPAYNPPAHKG